MRWRWWSCCCHYFSLGSVSIMMTFYSYYYCCCCWANVALMRQRFHYLLRTLPWLYYYNLLVTILQKIDRPQSYTLHPTVYWDPLQYNIINVAIYYLCRLCLNSCRTSSLTLPCLSACDWFRGLLLVLSIQWMLVGFNFVWLITIAFFCIMCNTYLSKCCYHAYAYRW